MLLGGGHGVAAIKEDGTSVEVKVRMLRLREYAHAMALLDREMELVAYVCGITAVQLQELAPESYEALVVKVREVNKDGFFSYSARQVERANESLRMLPQEVWERVLGRTGLPMNGSPSSMRLPGVPPPAG